MDKLKPCPFCGSDDVKHYKVLCYRPPCRQWGIECNNCKATYNKYFDTEIESINAWNRREE